MCTPRPARLQRPCCGAVGCRSVRWPLCGTNQRPKDKQRWCRPRRTGHIGAFKRKPRLQDLAKRARAEFLPSSKPAVKQSSPSRSGATRTQPDAHGFAIAIGEPFGASSLQTGVTKMSPPVMIFHRDGSGAWRSQLEAARVRLSRGEGVWGWDTKANKPLSSIASRPSRR